MDKYILRRTDKSALGFGSSLKDNSSEAEKALLRKVEPHDLVKFLILLHKAVARLLEHANQSVLVQIVQHGNDRQTADQFRDQAELDQIVGFHLAQQSLLCFDGFLVLGVG